MVSQETLWRKAAEVDCSLQFDGRVASLLRRKFLAPEPYTRKRLFDCLASRRPVVFRDFAVKLSKNGAPYTGEMIDLLQYAFPKRRRVRARVGKREEFRSIAIGDLLTKWQRQRSR